MCTKRGRAFSTIVTLLIAQIAGRGVCALAIVMDAYLFSSPVGNPVIWKSILTRLPGLILQWVLISIILFCVEEKTYAA